jgi:hypothetical protein
VIWWVYTSVDVHTITLWKMLKFVSPCLETQADTTFHFCEFCSHVKSEDVITCCLAGLSHTSRSGHRWVLSNGRIMMSMGMPKKPEKHPISLPVRPPWSYSVFNPRSHGEKPTPQIAWTMTCTHKCKLRAFWVVTPCTSERASYLAETYRFHLHGWRVR